MYGGSGLEDELFEIEKNAVLNSHKQIAISSQLVNYWKDYFHYHKDTYGIIPCTINTDGDKNSLIYSNSVTKFLNSHKNSIIVVFSGGNGRWQQINKICSIAGALIEKQANVAFIFLTPQNNHIDELQTRYRSRLLQIQVAPNQVTPILKKCDYGIVLRENNITNNVASPVKIAEYLAAGLKIIISPNIGDYSKLIEDNGLGFIVNNSSMPNLKKPPLDDKITCKEFAYNNLTKGSVKYKEFLFY